MDVPGGGEDIVVLMKRFDFLECLADGPLHKPDLEERLDHSRSTVDRAIRSLEDAGYVRRETPGYVLTQTGRLAGGRYREFLSDQQAIRRAGSVLDALPSDVEVPPSLLRDATVEQVDSRYLLVETVADVLERADRYRVCLPHRIDSRHLRICHARVRREELELDLIARPPVLSALREEFPGVATDLSNTPAVTVRSGETPPFGLLVPYRSISGRSAATADREVTVGTGRDVTATADREVTASSDTEPICAILVVFDGETVAGFVSTRNPDAIEWALEQLETVSSEASDATDRLRNEDAVTTLSLLSGDRLPTRLRTEGFVRLDETFFEHREPLEPAAGWRAGLGLPEVAAGYAVDRPAPGRKDGADGAAPPTDSTRPSGDSLATYLLERLDANGCVALVGPAGSGKSTVAKQVACRWREQVDGIVCYRESDGGHEFESTAALEALLYRTTRPTLVVVEDAVRRNSAAIFRVIDACAGRDDVAFLLDAREDEWSDPLPEPVDARAEAVRHAQVETVPMPALDRETCQRLVSRLDSLTDRPVALDTDTLYEEVVSADESRAGSMLTLAHRLSRYLDPLAEFDDRNVTPLEADVDRVRTMLEALGTDALDVGVLVNLLNLAGVGVYPAYVYALSADDETVTESTVEEALAALRGHVIFDVDDSPRYEVVHETWSARFLERFSMACGDRESARRVGRCVSALLALADDRERRAQVTRVTDDETGVERILADPTAWADETVSKLFTVGRTYGQLSGLFGSTADETIELPAACSAHVPLACARWRGELFVEDGALAAAEAEFEWLLSEIAASLAAPDGESTLTEAETTRVRIDSLLGRTRVAKRRGDLETARCHGHSALRLAEATDRPRDVVRSRYRLALVAKAQGETDDLATHLEACLEEATALHWPKMIAHASIERGRLAEIRGNYDHALEYLSEAESICRTMGDRRGEGRTRQLQGRVAIQQGAYETASEHYLRALELAEDRGDDETAARVLTSLGDLANKTGELGPADQYEARALSIAERIGAQGLVQTIYLNRGSEALVRDDLDRAQSFFNRALEVARTLDSPHKKARTRERLAALYARQGAYDRADESSRLARRLASASEDDVLELRSILTRCQALDALGEFETAAEILADALDLAEELGRPETRADIYIWLSATARLRGDLDEAERYAHQALETHGVVGRVAANGAVRLGEVALERASYEEAAGHFDDAIERYRSGGYDLGATSMLVPRARIARLRGAYERADELVDEVLSSVSPDRPRLRATALVERAGLAREHGDFEAAEADLTSGLETLENLGARMDVSRARVEYGKLERDRGALEAASTHLIEAADTYLDTGATRRAHRVVDTLLEVFEQREVRDATEEVTDRAPMVAALLDERSERLQCKQ